ncbi:MAG: TetR/AcrR family transcriptional regulator, partial [Polyangiaceae bacterium]
MPAKSVKNSAKLPSSGPGQRTAKRAGASSNTSAASQGGKAGSGDSPRRKNKANRDAERGRGSQSAHRYHHGDLRRALIDQATRLVQKEGHPAITVREVARRIGVTNTAAHYHFRTREALLAAVAIRGFEAMTAALATAMAPADRAALDVTSRLAALGHGYIAHALENGRIYQLMFSAETAVRDEFPELREAGDRMFALLVDAIRAGQEAGIVRGGDPHDAALVAWSTAHGFASLALEKRLTLPGLEKRSTAE